MIHGLNLFCKLKTEKCGMQKYSAPLSQYFVEPSFTAKTAASLENEIIAHSFLQNTSRLICLDGECL